jgi:Uma2 family endonuclease
MASSSSMRLKEYLGGPEYPRHRELIWGVVREPPSPFAPHQRASTRIAALLDEHVRARDLGTVLAAPMDVVLDEHQALVVQPDVMFISHARGGIIRDFVWGAPDLVVEVASRWTTRYDRTTKLGWYHEYGVRECWLVDPDPRTVVVVSLQSGTASTSFRPDERVRSEVLPEFAPVAGEFFA